MKIKTNNTFLENKNSEMLYRLD